MTKAEVRNRLLSGETMDSIFRFRPGQECMIFKAEEFSTGDEIIYIPDIDLNEIPVDRDLSVQIPWGEWGVDTVLSKCYTGKDFLELCDGNEKKARVLFDYVDWQHPSSAWPEIQEDWEE